MKTLILKPQHETSVIGQLLQLKSSINYHKNEIAPNLYQVAEWEQKEYIAIDANNKAELEKLKAYVIENEATFNELLCSYNLSVAVFINKFILN